MINTATHLPMDELLKITELLLDNLVMIPRYAVLTDILNKSAKAKHTTCFRICYVAMTNDIVSRIIRVFDASKRSYSVFKLLSSWGEESTKACKKLGVDMALFKGFESEIKPFRDTYFSHIDEKNSKHDFDVQKDLWDSKDIDRKRLLDVSKKAYSVLLEIYDKNNSTPYEKAPEYNGDDLAVLLEQSNL